MVGEFPELQGLMGRYYAEHDGESPDVAAAIEQHYWPRFAGDGLPRRRRRAGRRARRQARGARRHVRHRPALPTGDKDPFGLRRAALGVIRILIEKQLALAAAAIDRDRLRGVRRGAGGQGRGRRARAFIYDRLRGYLREQGYYGQPDRRGAVPSGRADIDVVPARLAAVQAFERLPEAGALAAANKRIVNILRKSASDAAPAVDRARLADGAEHDLYLAFQKLLPDRRRSLRAQRLRRRAAGARQREAGRSTASSTT